MRANKFVAQATGLSRRAADQAIKEGRVFINSREATLGDNVAEEDSVQLDNQVIRPVSKHLTIMLNKPVGYICSRAGQGSRTIYELLPPDYAKLKPVGRLDKDSSGLLLLSDDGDLANSLTHPSYAKTKVYKVTLDKPLTPAHKTLLEQGVKVDDYTSCLELAPIDDHTWQVTLRQGRNRQIRRTFGALGYVVQALHRTGFGPYELAGLPPGQHRSVKISDDE